VKELRSHEARLLRCGISVSAAVLALAAAGVATAAVECPRSLSCELVSAAYQQNTADPGDYGNYDLANRPDDRLAVRYVVLHDTEVSYDATLAIFQNSLSYVSAHYVTRSADGRVAQMVATRNVAWHAGNWWINTHSVGIENEGFALEGNTWFTHDLYRSLAKLTRYTAGRYGIPLDRAHIIGHDDVPGPTRRSRPACTGIPAPSSTGRAS
jgi:N-acetyl-anhydromuramyl-L-alanine amidase AmpD